MVGCVVLSLVGFLLRKENNRKTTTTGKQMLENQRGLWAIAKKSGSYDKFINSEEPNIKVSEAKR